MPVSVTEVGIKGIEDFALAYEAEVEASAEESEPVLNHDGTLATTSGDTFNVTNTLKMKGKGDLPAGLVAALGTAGSFEHESLAEGKIVIMDVNDSENADKHNEWEMEAKHYPNAVVEEGP